MLVDVLQKITTSLSREEFASILFRLIQPDCGRVTTRIEQAPYNELKPFLNEHYTMTVIRNLNAQKYEATNISSILSHLYQYSIVTMNSTVASLQLQPYVTLNMDKSGKYIYTYKTYNQYDHLASIIHMNDFKYITEPIEFIEKPCTVDYNACTLHIDEMELLYSHEKCDQYLAFQMMIQNNSTESSEATKKPQAGPTLSAAGTSRRTFNIQQSSRLSAAGSSSFNKTVRSVLSLPFVLGYYYYGLTASDKKGRYKFDEK